VLAEMEREGIYLDVELLKKEGAELVQSLSKIKQKIFSAAGEEFNLNSPKQLSDILYNKLGLKANTSSTSADVLEELAEENPIVQEILAYRTLEKLRSTYIEALPSAINPVTDKIHCNFNLSQQQEDSLAKIQIYKISPYILIFAPASRQDQDIVF
jgi:DNA polymerase-1